MEDSYIHDLYNSAEAHSDGIQFATGHLLDGQIVPGVVNVTIRHNTIYGMGSDGSFATSAIIDHSAAVNTNVLIENNLLAGGAYALYCHRLHGHQLSGAQQSFQPQVQLEGGLLRPRVRLCGRDPVRQRVPRDRAALAPRVNCVPRSEREAPSWRECVRSGVD